MKKTTSLLILGIFIMSILSLAVSADVQNIQVTNPSASEVVRGDKVQIDGTYANSTAAGYTGTSQSLNLSVYHGGNGARLCSNTSLETTTWSCNIDFNSLNDNSSLVLNITIGNQSAGGIENSTTVTIINDDTAPTASVSVLSGQETAGGVLFADCSASTDNIDTSLTYAVDLTDPHGNNATTGTTSTHEFFADQLLLTGDYTLSCTVTDDDANAESSPITGQNNTATTTVFISSEDDGIQITEIIRDEEERSNKLLFIFGGFFVLMVGLATLVVVLTRK